MEASLMTANVRARTITWEQSFVSRFVQSVPFMESVGAHRLTKTLTVETLKVFFGWSQIRPVSLLLLVLFL